MRAQASNIEHAVEMIGRFFSRASRRTSAAGRFPWTKTTAATSAKSAVRTTWEFTSPVRRRDPGLTKARTSLMRSEAKTSEKLKFQAVSRGQQIPLEQSEDVLQGRHETLLPAGAPS